MRAVAKTTGLDLSVAILSMWLTSACAATPHAPGGPGPGPVEFVALEPSRPMIDCSNGAELTRPCRVRLMVMVSTLRAHLDAGTPVWRNKDELTFAYQGAAKSVAVVGGIESPLSPLRNSDLWTVTVKVPRLDQATISYAFIAIGGSRPPDRTLRWALWRGPASLLAIDTGNVLHGRVIQDSVNSRFLPGYRSVLVYEPPRRGDAPLVGAAYLGDGGAVRTMAPFVDTLMADGRLPRIVLVGVESDTTRAQRADELDGRSAEYLMGFAPGDRKFLAHEQFFVGEVIPWAEARYDLPRVPERRAVGGYSNSAAFAIQMGLRHPETFGRVIALSPAGTPAAMPVTPSTAHAHFFLLGGSLEPAMHAKAVSWAKLFADHGVPYRLEEPVAGHDFLIWASTLPRALGWAFAAKGS